MLRAVTGDSTRTDLAAVGNELAQQVHIFVVESFNFLFAKCAGLGLHHLVLVQQLLALVIACHV